MSRIIPNASTDVTEYFVMRDSTNHAPKADVTITDIDIYYQEQGAAQAAKADLTALAAADSAHADNKGYHCGNSVYRIDWPDAAFDGGIGKRVILIVVCTGCDTVYREVLLSPQVDVLSISGDATAADNAEAFFDGTGYAGTNNVIPTTTTVTNMVTANVTQISGDSTAADNLELYCDGTTPQPVNVTQMGGSALSTSTAQIGVNVIQAAGTAWGSGAITAGSIASNAIAAAKIATGAITNAKFAAGAIDAAAIAANAIGASELAGDAVTEIVTGVWNAATASYGGAGTYGQAIEDMLADTNELQTDLVDGGRVDLIIDAIVADTNELQTDWVSGGRLDILLDEAATMITTMVEVDPTESYYRWKATSLDHVITPLTTVDTVVDGIVTELAKVPKSDGTASWNATALAAMQQECTDALNAYDAPTKTEMDSAFTTTNGKIDTVDNFIDTEIAAILADTNELQTDWANGGRLDLILDAASAPSAATVADAVWDEVLSGHAGAGSAGAALSAAGSAGDPWSTLIPGSYGAGTAGKILGDNINAPIGTVDTVVDGLATELAKVPKSDSTVIWNATALASIQTECTDALNAYDPPTKGEMDSAFATTDGYIDTEITAISSTITTMDGKVDSILEDTGTTLPAAISGAASGLWNVLLTALTTTGSIGKALADWLVARPAGSTAFTASDVAVCNNALLLIGNTSITALTDDTKAAKLCLQFYQQSLDAVLRAYTWNCATVRSAALTATTTPTFGYSYAFTLPADCLRVLMIEDDQAIPFKVESGVLLTDESTCKISYIKRITPDDADSLLLEAISARLAATIAFPLTNSTSASEAAWKLYEKKLDEAQSVDAFEGTAPQMASDDWINSRS